MNPRLDNSVRQEYGHDHETKEACQQSRPLAANSMLNVSLTSEERKDLLDYAARLEKRSRYWRATCWAAVFSFFAGLFLLFATYHFVSKFRSFSEVPLGAFEIPKDADPKLVSRYLGLIAAYTGLQETSLRVEFYFALKAVVAAVIGTALFIYVVSDWRRDRRDRVIAKLLRSVAASDTGHKEHES